MTRAILIGTLLGLAGGVALWFLASPTAAGLVWAATAALALGPLTLGVVRDLTHGRLGVDLIALLGIAGALAVGEYLAAAVVALMLSGGNALESYADGRARRELLGLLARAPREVRRYQGDSLEVVPIDQVAAGDRLLVRPGEVVPVDGLLAARPDATSATLDESALTGEALPVQRREGDAILSGVLNAGGPFDLTATARATDSTYAGILRLVATAQAAKAPLIRLADRYALVFLAVTLAVAGGAWAIGGNAELAVAVLVVATPCPLILAAPVAIVAGISRAARHGIIFKGGGALETLARGTVLLLDKTGTITKGEPHLDAIEVFAPSGPAATGHPVGRDPVAANELLRLAASLDQVSPHVLAGALVRATRDRHLRLSFPVAPHEELGQGLRGQVDGREVALGRLEWLMASANADTPLPPALVEHAKALRQGAQEIGASAVFVSVDGSLSGALVLADELRPDAAATLRQLRAAGLVRQVMVTGDRRPLAEAIAKQLGLDGVYAEQTPEDKLRAVAAERGQGVLVMVGDGINDAPALAAADVGVALAARGGATATSEAADVVIIQDRLDRLASGVEIARRARGIAVQSILIGMLLSMIAMGFAACGLLPPVAGALLQEAIDVAVILNALRAL
jgi:heavy metal translocating P-type ATPase